MTAILSLAIYLTWLVCAFGIRTYLHHRRTGDTGWRGVSGRPGSAHWWAGVLFTVALLIGFAAPIAEIAGLDRVVNSTSIALGGTVLAVIGVLATVAAQTSMRDSWRIGVDASETTTLRTEGVFRIVRNPIFTAMVTTAAGLALMTPNVVAVVGVVLLICAVQLQVRVVEEPYLRSVHGDAFTAYEGSVGRFAPWNGRR